MRARNIKPGLFKNEVLGAADPLFSLTYAGLWCLADREGRMEDRPARIHIELNPWRALTDTERALAWLNEQGFIVRYEVDGERFLCIPKFHKHQNPHVREKPSVYPAFQPAQDKHQSSTVPAQDKHQSSPADSGFLIPDSLKPENGFPHPDSHDSGIPDSGIPGEATGVSPAVTETEIEKAMKVIREPRHAKFSDRDLATIAETSVEAVREAKKRRAAGTRRT